MREKNEEKIKKLKEEQNKRHCAHVIVHLETLDKQAKQAKENVERAKSDALKNGDDFLVTYMEQVMPMKDVVQKMEDIEEDIKSQIQKMIQDTESYYPYLLADLEPTFQKYRNIQERKIH